MACSHEITTILTLVKSQKVRDQNAGLKQLTEFYENSQNVLKREDYTTIFQTFCAVIPHRLEQRSTTASDTLKRFAYVTKDLVNIGNKKAFRSATVKAILDLCRYTLLTTREADEVEPYAQCLLMIVQHRPHFDHMSESQLENLVSTCLNVLNDLFDRNQCSPRLLLNIVQSLCILMDPQLSLPYEFFKQRRHCQLAVAIIPLLLSKHGSVQTTGGSIMQFLNIVLAIFIEQNIAEAVELILHTIDYWPEWITKPGSKRSEPISYLLLVVKAQRKILSDNEDCKMDLDESAISRIAKVLNSCQFSSKFINELNFGAQQILFPQDPSFDSLLFQSKYFILILESAAARSASNRPVLEETADDLLCVNKRARVEDDLWEFIANQFEGEKLAQALASFLVDDGQTENPPQSSLLEALNKLARSISPWSFVAAGLIITRLEKANGLMWPTFWWNSCMQMLHHPSSSFCLSKILMSSSFSEIELFNVQKLNSFQPGFPSLSFASITLARSALRQVNLPSLYYINIAKSLCSWVLQSWRECTFQGLSLLEFVPAVIGLLKCFTYNSDDSLLPKLSLSLYSELSEMITRGLIDIIDTLSERDASISSSSFTNLIYSSLLIVSSLTTTLEFQTPNLFEKLLFRLQPIDSPSMPAIFKQTLDMLIANQVSLDRPTVSQIIFLLQELKINSHVEEHQKLYSIYYLSFAILFEHMEVPELLTSHSSEMFIESFPYWIPLCNEVTAFQSVINFIGNNILTAYDYQSSFEVYSTIILALQNLNLWVNDVIEDKVLQILEYISQIERTKPMEVQFQLNRVALYLKCRDLDPRLISDEQIFDVCKRILETVDFEPAIPLQTNTIFLVSKLPNQLQLQLLFYLIEAFTPTSDLHDSKDTHCYLVSVIIDFCCKNDIILPYGLSWLISPGNLRFHNAMETILKISSEHDLTPNGLFWCCSDVLLDSWFEESSGQFPCELFGLRSQKDKDFITLEEASYNYFDAERTDVVQQLSQSKLLQSKIFALKLAKGLKIHSIEKHVKGSFQAVIEMLKLVDCSTQEGTHSGFPTIQRPLKNQLAESRFLEYTALILEDQTWSSGIFVYCLRQLHSPSTPTKRWLILRQIKLLCHISEGPLLSSYAFEATLMIILSFMDDVYFYEKEIVAFLNSLVEMAIEKGYDCEDEKKIVPKWMIALFEQCIGCYFSHPRSDLIHGLLRHRKSRNKRWLHFLKVITGNTSLLAYEAEFGEVRTLKILSNIMKYDAKISEAITENHLALASKLYFDVSFHYSEPFLYWIMQLRANDRSITVSFEDNVDKNGDSDADSRGGVSKNVSGWAKGIFGLLKELFETGDAVNVKVCEECCNRMREHFSEEISEYLPSLFTYCHYQPASNREKETFQPRLDSFDGTSLHDWLISIASYCVSKVSFLLPLLEVVKQSFDFARKCVKFLIWALVENNKRYLKSALSILQPSQNDGANRIYLDIFVCLLKLELRSSTSSVLSQSSRQAAASAIKLSKFEAALMFLEVSGNVDGDSARVICENITSDPDISFCVPLQNTLENVTSVLKRNDSHALSLMFESARSDCQRHSDLKHASDLSEALMSNGMFGIAKMAAEKVNSPIYNIGSNEYYEYSWKTQNWDVPDPEQSVSQNSLFFRGFRTLYEKFTSSINDLCAIGKESALNQSPLLLSTVSDAVTILKTVSSETYDFQAIWRRQMQIIDWRDENIVLAAATLWQVIDQKRRGKGAFHIAGEILARHGDLLRASGALQKAVNNSMFLHLHGFQYARFDLACTLWALSQKPEAISMLESEYESTSNMKVVSRLVLWKSEFRFESPESIFEKYIAPISSRLQSHSEADFAGIENVEDIALAFHIFAKFCDAQYNDPDVKQKQRRLKRLISERFNEHKEYEKKLSGNATPSEKKMSKLAQARTLKLMSAERKELATISSSMDTYLKESMSMYVRGFTVSDAHPDDVTRFCALWLSNLTNKDVQNIVIKSFKDVPKRKFISWIRQLSACMKDHSHIWSPLAAICEEYPHHTLYDLLGTQKQTEFWSFLKKRKICDSTMLDQLEDLRKRMVSLANVKIDPKLKQFKLTEIGKKGRWQYKHLVPPTKKLSFADTSFPYIFDFENTVNIATGLSAPKIVGCVGSDGVLYRMVAKAGTDDMRQDAIMQQVFDGVNVFFANHEQAKKRRLKIRTYKVIPLANKCGLIEFVKNSEALISILQPLHASRYPHDYSYQKARELMQQVQYGTTEERIKVYLDIERHVHPVMRYFFFANFPDPCTWFNARTAYSRSVAANSMVGHILGLGDRHCSNILIDNTTGEMVNIDLGIAFDQGKLLKFPELIPFRLTRDIVDGFGSFGVEGPFKMSSKAALGVLREETESIISILDVLRNDPLYAWTISPLRSKAVNQGEKVEEVEASRLIDGVRNKLSKHLSTEAVVNELIRCATNPNNLALIFHGWNPFY